MSTAQLTHDGVTVLACAGILDCATTKVEELRVFFRGFSVVAGIGFVIFQALASRGAFARIIISGLAAGVFIWIVWNVTDLRDRVGREIDTTPGAQQLPGRPDLLAVPTPARWARLGDLAPGDQIFDRWGNPSFVVGVSPASAAGRQSESPPAQRPRSASPPAVDPSEIPPATS